MKKCLTIILVFFALAVFATWQYRLLCLLLVVLLNRKWMRSRWPKACLWTICGLAIAIFIAIPNYFQRGRTQLVYLGDNGKRVSTPLPVYLINAILPEEELMNAGMKATAILPPASLSPVFKNLGSRFIRDAQHDFWNGKALTFYAPYNVLSWQGSNPGSFAIILTSCDVIKHSKTKVILFGGGKDASSAGLPRAASRLERCGTRTALMYDENDNHYMMVHQADEMLSFLNKELLNL